MNMKTAASARVYPFEPYFLWVDERVRRSGSLLLELSYSLVIVAALGALSYWLISHYVFQSVIVSGNSMKPTLLANNNCWLIHSAYWIHGPRRTDIVAVKDPEDGCLMVKRIIGLPGDCIYLNQGKVFVNGRPVKEAYLPEKTYTFATKKSGTEFLTIGNGQYFVLGDNRGNSCDSRTFGPASRDNILGKVTY